MRAIVTPMNRRGLLKLGAVSAGVLFLASGAGVLLAPILEGGKLNAQSRAVMTTLSLALLDGSLPDQQPERQTVTGSLILRIEALVVSLPSHVQAELSQLLGIIGSAPGRVLLMGLSSDWTNASISDVQRALTSMRESRAEIRLQAYLALHDIVSGAYFSDPATWSRLGYPGPLKI